MYSINDKLQFGKYEGFTIKEVYCGQRYLSQNFMTDFLEFKLENLTFDIEYRSDLADHNVVIKDFEVLINNELFFEIALNTDSSKHIKTKENAMDWIAYHLTLDDSQKGAEVFGSPNDCINEINKIKSSTHKPSTDAQYINWCIRNLDSFFLRPDELISLQYEHCYHFYGAHLFYSAKLCHYKPNISVTIFKFDEDTIDYNKKKFDIYNLKKKRKPTKSNGSIIEDSYVTYRNIDESLHSDGYGGVLSDGFINDVLDGDPDAHWNID